MALPEDLSVFFDPDDFAEAGTYTPASGGAAVSITCIVDRDVDAVGEYGQVVERRTEISFPRSDYAARPKRGDRIALEAEAFVVDGLVSDDGAVVRVAVRED